MTRVSFPWRRAAVFAAADGGSSAVEFALVVPLAIALLFGTISIGNLMYANSMLHYATQDAARCGAVKTNICTNTTTTQTYAQSLYRGPTTAPAFVATTTATCSSVSATATFNVITGLRAFPITLNASACYPLQPA